MKKGRIWISETFRFREEKKKVPHATAGPTCPCERETSKTKKITSNKLFVRRRYTLIGFVQHIFTLCSSNIHARISLWLFFAFRCLSFPWSGRFPKDVGKEECGVPDWGDKKRYVRYVSNASLTKRYRSTSCWCDDEEEPTDEWRNEPIRGSVVRRYRAIRFRSWVCFWANFSPIPWAEWRVYKSETIVSNGH